MRKEFGLVYASFALLTSCGQVARPQETIVPVPTLPTNAEVKPVKVTGIKIPFIPGGEKDCDGATFREEFDFTNPTIKRAFVTVGDNLNPDNAQTSEVQEISKQRATGEPFINKTVISGIKNPVTVSVTASVLYENGNQGSDVKSITLNCEK